MNEWSGRKRYREASRTRDLIVQALEIQGIVFERVPGSYPCLITEDRKRATCFKIRKSSGRDDIVLDLYEPWYGVTDERTREGRDYPGAEVYICLSSDGKTIRLIEGLDQIIKSVVKEWNAAGCVLPTFRSEEFPGALVRSTVDRWNGRAKILMFVRPSSMECRSFAMIWPSRRKG